MPITSRLKANSGVTADASNRVSAWADSLNLENLVLWSEDLSNAAYSNVNCSVSTDAVANPLNGEVTADLLANNVTNATHELRQDINVVSGQTYRISAYVKLNTGTTRFRLVATVLFTNVNFAINGSGVVELTGAGASNVTVDSLGNGWYRMSMTGVATGTGAAQIRLALLDSGLNASYAGDGTGWYVWGVQLQLASADPTYYKTTSTAYTLTTIANFTQGTDANKPLLSRADNKENLALSSEDLSNTTYYQLDGITVSTNIQLTLDRLTATAGTGTHRIFVQTAQDSFYIAGQSYTLTTRVALETAQYIQLLFPAFRFGTTQYANFDLIGKVVTFQGAGLVSSSIEEVGAGLFDISITAIATSTGTDDYFFLSFIPNEAAARSPSFTAVGTETILAGRVHLRRTSTDSTYLATTTFPQYAGVNGRQSLVFNGAQLLTTTSTLANLFTASDGILYAVVRPFITSLAQIVTRSSVAGRKSLYIDSNTFQNYNNDGVQDIASSPTISANNLYIARIRHIGGFIYSAFDIGNGFQEGLAVASANTDNMTYTYSVGSGSSGLYGQILEIVTYNEGTPNLDMERSLRQQYLNPQTLAINPFTGQLCRQSNPREQLKEFLFNNARIKLV